MEEYQGLDDFRKNKIIESAKNIYLVYKKGTSEVFDLPKYEAQREEILDELKYADISKFPSEDLKENFRISIQKNMQINISSNDLNQIFAEAFLLFHKEAINTLEQKIKTRPIYKQESDPSIFNNAFLLIFLKELNGLANEDVITKAAQIFLKKNNIELSYHKGMLLTSESDNEYERISTPNTDAIPETGKDSLADNEVKSIMKKFKSQIDDLKDDIILNHKLIFFSDKEREIFPKVLSNLNNIFSNRPKGINSKQIEAIAINVMNSLKNFYWKRNSRIYKEYNDIFEKHQKKLNDIELRIVNEIENDENQDDKKFITLLTEGFIEYFSNKENFSSEGIDFEELKIAIQKKAKDINEKYSDEFSEAEKEAAYDFLKENEEKISSIEQEIIKEFKEKSSAGDSTLPKEKSYFLPRYFAFFKNLATTSKRIALVAATIYSNRSYLRTYLNSRKAAGIKPKKYNKKSPEKSKLKSFMEFNKTQ